MRKMRFDEAQKSNRLLRKSFRPAEDALSG